MAKEKKTAEEILRISKDIHVVDRDAVIYQDGIDVAQMRMDFAEKALMTKFVELREIESRRAEIKSEFSTHGVSKSKKFGVFLEKLENTIKGLCLIPLYYWDRESMSNADRKVAKKVAAGVKKTNAHEKKQNQQKIPVVLAKIKELHDKKTADRMDPVEHADQLGKALADLTILRKEEALFKTEDLAGKLSWAYVDKKKEECEENFEHFTELSAEYMNLKAQNPGAKKSKKAAEDEAAKASGNAKEFLKNLSQRLDNYERIYIKGKLKKSEGNLPKPDEFRKILEKKIAERRVIVDKIAELGPVENPGFHEAVLSSVDRIKERKAKDMIRIKDQRENLKKDREKALGKLGDIATQKVQARNEVYGLSQSLAEMGEEQKLLREKLKENRKQLIQSADNQAKAKSAINIWRGSIHKKKVEAVEIQAKAQKTGAEAKLKAASEDYKSTKEGIAFTETLLKERDNWLENETKNLAQLDLLLQQYAALSVEVRQASINMQTYQQQYVHMLGEVGNYLDIRREDLKLLETQATKLKTLTKRLKTVCVYMDVSKASFPNLVGIIRYLNQGTRLGVSSFNVTFMVGISLGLSDPTGKLNAKVGLAVEISLGINVQDDRRLRATTGIAFKAIAELKFPLIFEAKVTVDLFSITSTAVYRDEYQWAARLTDQLAMKVVYLRAAASLGFADKVDLTPREGIEILELAIKLADSQSQKADFKQYIGLLKLKVVHVESAEILKLHGSLSSVAAKSGIGLDLNTIPKMWTAKRPVTVPEDQRFVYMREDLASWETLTGSQREVVISLTIPGFTVGFKVITISNHPSLDNDGVYLNISLAKGALFEFIEGQSFADKGGKDIELAAGSLKGMADEVKTVTDKFPNCSKWEDASKLFSSAEFKGIFGKKSWGLALKSGITGELNFIWSQGLFRLQYFRLSGSSCIETSTSVPIPIPFVGPLLSFDLGFSLNLSHSMFEVMGDNTFSYLLTIFNGFNHPTRNEPKRQLKGDAKDWTGLALWNEYINNHNQEVWDILCKIAEEGSAVHKEVKGIGAEGANLIASCRQKCLQDKEKKAFNQSLFLELASAGGVLDRALIKARDTAAEAQPWKSYKNPSGKLDSDDETGDEPQILAHLDT